MGPMRPPPAWAERAYERDLLILRAIKRGSY